MATKHVKVTKSSWIGAQGAAFERVGLAFQVYGFTLPRPDTEGGSGAYATNIANQYFPHLTEREALALITYGVTSSRTSLQQELAHPSYRLFETVEELADSLEELADSLEEEEASSW